MTTQYIPASPVGGAAPGQTGTTGRVGPPLPSPLGDAKLGERLPKVRRPRRPALAAAGVVLMVLCGLFSAALAAASDHRVKVLALARDVQAGQALSAQDLKAAEISGSGVRALGAVGASSLVGQTVTASLSAGTLLNPSMLTAAPLPGAGLQLVALAVKPGGVPAEAVPGRNVSIVRVVAAADGKTTVPAVLVEKALLVSVRTDISSGTVVLSVQVPTAAVVNVAQASAAGAVAVTLLPVTR
jgi:hypothetical protein